MSLRKQWFVLGASAACVLGLAASSAGCRGDETTTTSGSGGSGNASATSSSSTGSGMAGAGGGTGGSGVGGGTGGTGGNAACAGQEVTVEQVTNVAAPGAVGKGTPVSLKGVVATSRKFQVAPPGMSGSCLFGVFVSAPGLAEAKPYSGIMVVNYGNPAAVPQGGNTAYCGKISSRAAGELEPGDLIPDDVKPGDVLDIIGVASEYIVSSCGQKPTDSTTPQKQIAFVCGLERTGTAPVPAAHVFPEAEATKIADQKDADFHKQWGGALIRVENVTPTPVADPNGGMGQVVVGKYGEILLSGSNIVVGDKLYYRGYESNKCFDGPVFPDLAVTWNHVQGLHYQNFCTWGMQPNDKCTDFDPGSADCVTDMLMCQ